MTEEVISKKEFEEIMKAKGEVRGAGMKSYAEFIRKEEGEEGLKKLEKTIRDLGYPIKYREISILSFYPIGLETITLVAIQRLFNYNDKKFQEMGKFGIFLSLPFANLLCYFISPEKFVEVAAVMWKEAGSIGDLKVQEYNLEERYLILRVENFHLHPLYCQVFKGYFEGAIKLIFKREAECQETKCTFRGDDFHQFLIKW